MTPEEREAEIDTFIEQHPTMTASERHDVCAQIHALLDIIGTDPNYESTRVKMCGYIQQLGCDPHSACSGES